MHYIFFIAIVAPLLCGCIWVTSEYMEQPAEFAYKSDDTGLHQMAGTFRIHYATEMSGQAVASEAH